MRSEKHRNKLVVKWRFLPDYVWKKYKTIGFVKKLGYDDVIGFGTMALMAAAKYWDAKRKPFKHFKLYAVSVITKYVLNKGMEFYSILRVPNPFLKNCSEKTKKKRKYAFSLSEIKIEYLKNQSKCNQEEEVIKKDFFLKTEKAIEQLTPKLKEAFNLIYFQGLTLQEAADTLKCTDRRVIYERIKRSIKNLREIMKITEE